MDGECIQSKMVNVNGLPLSLSEKSQSDTRQSPKETVKNWNIHRFSVNTLKYTFEKAWQSGRTPELRSHRVFLCCQFDCSLCHSTARGNKDGATLNLPPSSCLTSPKVLLLAFRFQTQSCLSSGHAAYALHTVLRQLVRQSSLYFVCVVKK